MDANFKMKRYIVLKKPLPTREVLHKRYYIDGKKLNNELILKILKESGYVVDEQDEPTAAPCKEWKGIKLRVMAYGMKISPLYDRDFKELITLVEQDDNFYRFCEMPGEFRQPKKELI